MTPPPLADAEADPDPTTQMAWPNARHSVKRASESAAPDVEYEGDEVRGERSSSLKRTDVGLGGKKRMSMMDLFNLSVSMGGAQIAWTVELGYGTPFLLSLGLSEQLTSLVWLAGPISGLVAQPIIGAISDSSTSKYRRRYWVVTSTAVLCIATLVLAYCQPIASFVVDLFQGGEGDWDPTRNRDVANTAIGFAVVAFYLLDFALNALQASLRNLLLDVTPSDQLSSANAWHSRMTQAGNIIGFGFGFLPLAKIPGLEWLGGTQFRKFCVVAMIVLVITVWVTCFTMHEVERVANRKHQGKLRDILNNIYTAIIKLPKPIRRVCFVQLFAFMGWFPFLFYSTTYVGQIMAYEMDAEPNAEVATRTGALAMLFYSLVAAAAGAVLPYLTSRPPLLIVQQMQVESDGKPVRLPRMPLLLRNVWMGALILFTIITLSTFFISKVWQACIAVSLVGICWAVACWVPFAIIMEFLKELEAKPKRPGMHSRSASRATYSSVSGVDTQAILESQQVSEDDPLLSPVEDKPVAGGTILGVHNLAIVMPQFIVALVSSAIFNAVDPETTNPDGSHDSYHGKNGVAWVLRFGGMCTLLGALMCRMLPLTRTEKEMRRRLGILRDLTTYGTSS
ncbi:MFS general substrate transporter [Peniophora sp. CONT]|nr:MFS general substrate transporter [Peniophora sp. CONT]